MKEIELMVINIVGDSFCVEADDGDKVFSLISKALKAGHKVKLSFLNVEILTTAFLNTAIGQLYRDFDEKLIKDSLSVDHLQSGDAIQLKRVTSTAKLYYSDPEAMQKSIDDILGEE